MPVRSSAGAVALLVAQVVVAASGFLLNAFLGRTLGPELFGVLGLIISVNTLATILVSSGLGGAATKFIAEKKSSKGEIHYKLLKSQLVAGAVAVVILALASPLVTAALGIGTFQLLFLFSLAYIPAQVLFTHQVSVFNGLKMFYSTATVLGGSAVVRLALTVILTLAGFTIAGPLAASIIAPLALFFLLWIPVKKEPHITPWRKLLDYAVPYSASSFIILLSQQLDVLSLQLITKNTEATGFYLAASSMARFIPTFIVAIAASVFPSIAALNSNAKKLRKYLETTVKFLLVFSSALSLVLFVYAYKIISVVFSEKFASSTALMQILVPAFGFAAIGLAFFHIFNAIGESKRVFMWSLSFIVILGGLLFFFINQWGAVGAAAAFLVTTFFYALFLYSKLTQRTGFSMPLSVLAKLVFALALSMAVGLFADSFLESKWLVFIEAPILLGFYYLLLNGLRVFEPRENEIVWLPIRMVLAWAGKRPRV